MKTIISVIFLSFCLTLSAQKMSVDSFKEASNDLSARTQARQDNNGEDCALVKVQVAASGVTFPSGVVGSVAFKNNEYWVYMPSGSKRLKVVHPSYLPLEVNFADHGVPSVKGKSTYVLTLVLGDLPQGMTQPKIQTGWIIIDSEPKGASVYVNDEFVGNTPLNNYKQAYGTYTYRLEHPNYHASAGTIELSSSRIEKKVTLLPAFGTISVTSNVTGAKVMIDGKDTGQRTPCTVQEVASGKHTVTIQMEQYAPLQQSVMVEDGKTAQLQADLSARFAKITIQSLEGAQIYCNGTQIATTQYSDNMMEGFYDLEVRLAHHESVTRQVQVVAGQAQDLTLNPIPIYGSLDVVSTPHDATVQIDGKEYGKTPLTVEQLLEGEHHVVLTAEGYTPETKTVTIKGNEASTLNVSLSNVPITTSISADIVDILNKINSSNTPTVNESTKNVEKTFTNHLEEKTFTVGGVTFTMKRVEGGTFQMGATSEQGSDAKSEESPVHSVTLSDYYIGETEVTQALWQVVMGSNPSYKKGNNLPVENVSWEECLEFIRILNTLTGQCFRLPTEAEWEYAARGGKKSRGYKYGGSNNLSSVAWYTGNSNNSTHSVKTKHANKLGLYDMSGNVWEWCQDWYGQYSRNMQTNPLGPSMGSYRLNRGGSWSHSSGFCRVSYRSFALPSARRSYLGLRLAL